MSDKWKRWRVYMDELEDLLRWMGQEIDAAERDGRLGPDTIVIEPTSGNTGIGLALAGAVRGYRVIITMPEKMSREKQVILEALGAKIVRTPTEAAWDSPESHIGVAQRMQKELPNAHILDQYGNPSNPNAHYYGTGQEIIDDMAGLSIDMVVMGAGTGGTITGVSQGIKARKPSFRTIAVEPADSPVLSGGSPGPHKIQGIGAGFVPEILDTALIDDVVTTGTTLRHAARALLSAGAHDVFCAVVARTPDPRRPT